jgi:hypothetical protein
MNLAIVSGACEEFWPIMAVAAANKVEYAVRHGCSCHLQQYRRKSAALKDAAGSQSVLRDRRALILDNLRSCDWLWFLDVDTLITNLTIDARTYCDDAAEVVIGQDVNGINNGSMFLRNADRVRAWVEEIYATAQVSDQNVMAQSDLRDKHGVRMKIVSQRLFNSFAYDRLYQFYGGERIAAAGGSWKPGDFVIHFPAQSIPKRIELMREYLQQVVI